MAAAAATTAAASTHDDYDDDDDDNDKKRLRWLSVDVDEVATTLLGTNPAIAAVEYVRAHRCDAAKHPAIPLGEAYNLFLGIVATAHKTDSDQFYGQLTRVCKLVDSPGGRDQSALSAAQQSLLEQGRRLLEQLQGIASDFHDGITADVRDERDEADLDEDREENRELLPAVRLARIQLGAAFDRLGQAIYSRVGLQGSWTTITDEDLLLAALFNGQLRAWQRALSDLDAEIEETVKKLYGGGATAASRKTVDDAHVVVVVNADVLANWKVVCTACAEMGVPANVARMVDQLLWTMSDQPRAQHGCIFLPIPVLVPLLRALAVPSTTPVALWNAIKFFGDDAALAEGEGAAAPSGDALDVARQMAAFKGCAVDMAALYTPMRAALALAEVFPAALDRVAAATTPTPDECATAFAAVAAAARDAGVVVRAVREWNLSA